jgi:hypothetical protein
MSLHILKMCVGCDGIDDLRQWQDGRLSRGEPLIHHTRNMPKRRDEILMGGSIYWIIKGAICVRQRILALDPGVDGEGTRFCRMRFDPDLVRTVRVSARPMQGWRYLEEADVPADLAPGFAEDAEEMPPALTRELKALGLL